jgi:hypothetical protein
MGVNLSKALGEPLLGCDIILRASLNGLPRISEGKIFGNKEVIK